MLIHLTFASRCSTTVESFPSAPSYSSNHGSQPELQKLRVLVGPPLKQPPKHAIVADSLMPVFPSIDSDAVNLQKEHSLRDENFLRPEGLNDFFIFCTSDFATVSKEVHVRTRRVRLLGLEVTKFIDSIQNIVVLSVKFSLASMQSWLVLCRVLAKLLFSRQSWVKADKPPLPILRILI